MAITAARKKTPEREHPWDKLQRKIRIIVKRYYNYTERENQEEEVKCNPVEMKMGQHFKKPPYWWTFADCGGLLWSFVEFFELGHTTMFILLVLTVQAKFLHTIISLRLYV